MANGDSFPETGNTKLMIRLEYDQLTLFSDTVFHKQPDHEWVTTKTAKKEAGTCVFTHLLRVRRALRSHIISASWYEMAVQGQRNANPLSRL
jgi:hypothetical protein